ncbi:hypothetical protein CONCODRAFT_6798 [Conidiobolus coronatus NRRL 28638]|uniref:FAS1 domain-containing protein n=1 Tax=Conidiobolus coronatus (strain ATCC 28846 / CBS 209.66 / NRRL 28638) TaxID=796925 RepID=A0A137P6T0_CONC2|nr:hypothetical protein CONCODRAFT_6798 [Conidiobolus coronatus NRRL 28638]|eukprot:KXN70631.1 hypothetical protein CONCODRAFT_6798 [Conidiobolus coronatus NRRL 28638]
MKLLNLLLFNFIQANTLFDVIQTVPNASNFLQGLNQTQEKQNLANILKNYSNITIFLPTNDAINNLNQGF